MKENLRILLLTALLALLISIPSWAQENCFVPCGGDVDFGYTSSDNIACLWTLPSGGFSTDCTLSSDDVCLNANGTYTVTITDDCGNTEDYTVDLIIQSPDLSLFQNTTSCFMFASISNCVNPTYQWTSPSGNIYYTQIINPVPDDDCGLWTFEILDCNGCTDCYAIETINFDNDNCCVNVPPDCTAGMFITQNNCTLTANVTNCDTDPPTGLTPTYLWSNGATTQSINVSVDGLYEVTVTGCCSDPLTDTHVVSGCEPPADCDCDVSLVMDNANCEIDVTVTGADCANYNMIVQKFNSQTCDNNNCTLYFGAAFSQSIGLEGNTGCRALYGGTNVSYRATLLDNGSGEDCDNVFSNCVVANCTTCEGITSVVNNNALTVGCSNGSIEFEALPGAIQWIIPECCNVDLFDNIGSYDVNVQMEVNGVVVQSTNSTNPALPIVNPVSPYDLNLQTNGAAYTLSCNQVSVGDLIEVTVTVDNVVLNGVPTCDYNGSDPIVFNQTYTVQQGDIDSCCPCEEDVSVTTNITQDCFAGFYRIDPNLMLNCLEGCGCNDGTATVTGTITYNIDAPGFGSTVVNVGNVLTCGNTFAGFTTTPCSAIEAWINAGNTTVNWTITGEITYCGVPITINEGGTLALDLGVYSNCCA